MRRRALFTGWKLGLAVVALALASGAGLAFFQVTAAQSHAASARSALARAALLLEGDGGVGGVEALERLGGEMAQAERELEALREGLGPLLPLSGYFGWLPGVGGWAKAAAPLVELTLTASRGGRTAVEALLPLASLASRGLQGLQDEAGLKEAEEGIARARTGLAAAGEEMDRLSVALKALDREGLPPVVQEDLERLEAALPIMREWMAAAPVALDLGEALVKAGLLGREMERLAQDPEPLLNDQAAWESLVEGAQGAERALKRAAEGLRAAKDEELRPWLRALGMERRDVDAVVGLLSALAQGGAAALEGIAPAREAFRREGFVLLQDGAFDHRLIEAAASAGPAFGRARGAFEEAKPRLEALAKSESLPHGEALLGPIDRLLPKLHGLAAMGEVSAQILPYVMGMDAPRNFLVIPQNADELRATGGFIVGSWLVSMDRGLITRLKFVDNFDVDYQSTRSQTFLPPREDMILYQWAGVWIFLDANWLPDYPSSARMAEGMYLRGQGVAVDGVITMNQYAMRELVGALGPLNIPGDVGQVTEENFLGIMEAGTDSRSHLFMDDVVQELLHGLGDAARPPQLVELLLRLDRVRREKQLLLYLNDGAAQEALRALNWDGAIPEVSGDYLFVVDTNLGFDKVNKSVEERLFYDVFLRQDGSAEAQLQVAYVNNSRGAGTPCFQQFGQVGAFYAEQVDTCYWDYLRIYVPRGSQLASATRMPWPETSLFWRLGERLQEETTVRVASESGKTQITGFFVVPRGEGKTFTFRYKLPAGVVVSDGSRATYTLYLQKQSGTLGHPYTVRVHLPEGARLEEMTPAPLLLSGGVAELLGRLKEDTILTVRFTLP